MSDDDNTFASFMTKKNDIPNSEGNIVGGNKTQKSLEEAKEKDKEEKNKELKDAKMNSVALANRYGKSDMMKLQAKNIVILIPFIIVLAIIILSLFFNGGNWLNKGINTLFNIMIGNK